jgi:hypothetical protein
MDYSSYCSNTFGGNVISDDIKEGCSSLKTSRIIEN